MQWGEYSLYHRVPSGGPEYIKTIPIIITGCLRSIKGVPMIITGGLEIIEVGFENIDQIGYQKPYLRYLNNHHIITGSLESITGSFESVTRDPKYITEVRENITKLENVTIGSSMYNGGLNNHRRS